MIKLPTHDRVTIDAASALRGRGYEQLTDAYTEDERAMLARAVADMERADADYVVRVTRKGAAIWTRKTADSYCVIQKG